MGERNITSGVMKTFKTIEEMIEFVNDSKNIETLESGEITLKDWIELGNLLEKYKKDYGQATNEKKTLRSKNEEFAKQVTELTAERDSLNSELTGLKELHSGNDKEALQKLNKQLSESNAKYNAEVAKSRELTKELADKPELLKQIEGYKTASNRSRILEEARKVMAQRKVPQNIIDDADYARCIADDFIIDDAGNIFTKGDTPQSMDNYVAAQQKEKLHWNPSSQGAGIETTKSGNEFGATNVENAVASLFVV